MTISEPTTLVSDWVLAAVAVALGRLLLRKGAGDRARARRLWGAAFLAGAAAAFSGGIVHGFAASLTPLGHDVLWKIVLVGIGVASSLILAGTVVATLAGRRRSAALAAAAGQLAIYLGLVSVSNDVRLAIWNGAATIVVVLVLALAAASRDPGRLGFLLLGLGLAAAGLVAQRAGVSIGILNHNDISHVLETLALWPFYRAGLRLVDRGPGESGAEP